jgi:hypothetical protein
MIDVNVMVVHNPLYFNLLLGKDYVYVKRSFVSTLFQVICFPHNGKIVMIEQILFIYHDLMVNHPPSLNDPYMPVISTPPQVNYVTTYPMCSTLNEREYLPSPELDLVVDMVNSLIGLLEPDIPTLIEVIDMYSFQSFFFPSNEDLLEAMVNVFP